MRLTVFHGMLSIIILDVRNVKNSLWNGVSATEHCYGFEECYDICYGGIGLIYVSGLGRLLSIIGQNPNDS